MPSVGIPVRRSPSRDTPAREPVRESGARAGYGRKDVDADSWAEDARYCAARASRPKTALSVVCPRVRLAAMEPRRRRFAGTGELQP